MWLWVGSIVWGTIKYKNIFVARKIFLSSSVCWMKNSLENSHSIRQSLFRIWFDYMLFLLSLARRINCWNSLFSYFSLVSSSIFDRCKCREWAQNNFNGILISCSVERLFVNYRRRVFECFPWKAVSWKIEHIGTHRKYSHYEKNEVKKMPMSVEMWNGWQTIISHWRRHIHFTSFQYFFFAFLCVKQMKGSSAKTKR